MKPTKAKMPIAPLIPRTARVVAEVGKAIPNKLRKVPATPTNVKLAPTMPKVRFV
jgi:hypothetical protein